MKQQTVNYVRVSTAKDDNDIVTKAIVVTNGISNVTMPVRFKRPNKEQLHKVKISV